LLFMAFISLNDFKGEKIYLTLELLSLRILLKVQYKKSHKLVSREQYFKYHTL
jgi:hypothetical protein